MEEQIKVILDMSEEVQNFLDQQGINIYEELQQDLPFLQIRNEPDPDALEGNRDIIVVILAVASLVSSLTPLIIRILNQYTPPNHSIHWEVEETERKLPDDTVIINRKYIHSDNEQRPWASLPYPTFQSSEKLSESHEKSNNQ